MTEEIKTNNVSLRDYLDLRINDTVSAADQRFDGQQLALKDALISQEKAVAAALEGTKEAINKADVATDKRFDLLSEKIDGAVLTISKSLGQSGLYVTQSDLNIVVDKIQTNFEIALRPVLAFMNSSQGQQKGISASWGAIIGIVGLIATILGIFAVISRFLP